MPVSWSCLCISGSFLHCVPTQTIFLPLLVHVVIDFIEHKHDHSYVQISYSVSFEFSLLGEKSFGQTIDIPGKENSNVLCPTFVFNQSSSWSMRVYWSYHINHTKGSSRDMWNTRQTVFPSGLIAEWNLKVGKYSPLVGHWENGISW